MIDILSDITTTASDVLENVIPTTSVDSNEIYFINDADNDKKFVKWTSYSEEVLYFAECLDYIDNFLMFLDGESVQHNAFEQLKSIDIDSNDENAKIHFMNQAFNVLHTSFMENVQKIRELMEDNSLDNMENIETSGKVFQMKQSQDTKDRHDWLHSYIGGDHSLFI